MPRSDQQSTEPRQPSADKKKRGAADMKNNKRRSFFELPVREKLGWIIVVIAAVLAFGVFRHFTANDDSLLELNRTFVILVLLWIAWPELEVLPKWLLTAVPIAAVVCAWRPQLLIVVLPLAFLYLMTRPPAKRREKNKKRNGAGLPSLFKKKK